MRKFIDIKQIIVLLALLLFGVAFYFLFFPWNMPTDENLKDYRERCSPIIEWLSHERERTGKYPDQLPPDLKRKLKSIPYPTTYEAYINEERDPQPGFCILIGEYSSTAPFVLIYSSENDKWFLDH